MAQAPTLKRTSTTGAGGAYIASVPSGDFTVCAWFQVSAAVGTYNTKICVTTSGDAATFAWVGVSSLSVQGYTPTSGFSASLTSVAVGDWIHCAITRTGSTIGVRVSKNGVATIYSAALTNSATPANIYLLEGNASGVDCSSASVDLVRVWSAVLSDAEILAEMASTEPARRANLWSFATLSDATLGVVDRSGNGRNWTAAAVTAGTANAYRVAWDTSLSGTANTRASTSASASTAVLLAGSAQASGTASAALSTAIRLGGSTQVTATLAAQVISAGFSGLASVRASMSAALSTSILLGGTASARASLQPFQLQTSIRLAGTAQVRSWMDPSTPIYLPAAYRFASPARLAVALAHPARAGLLDHPANAADLTRPGTAIVFTSHPKK